MLPPTGFDLKLKKSTSSILCGVGLSSPIANLFYCVSKRVHVSEYDMINHEFNTNVILQLATFHLLRYSKHNDSHYCNLNPDSDPTHNPVITTYLLY